MTSDSMNDRDEPTREAEWAWVADVYPEVPGPQPEAIDRTAAMAAAMVAKRGGRHGKPFRWIVGMAAVLMLMLLGRWLVFGPRQPTSRGSGPQPPRQARNHPAFERPAATS